MRRDRVDALAQDAEPVSRVGVRLSISCEVPAGRDP